MALKKRAIGFRRKGSLSYGRRNYLFFFAGMAVIIIGYIVMWNAETYSFRAITLAPLLLLVGYVVLVPLAIMYSARENPKKGSKPSPSSDNREE